MTEWIPGLFGLIGVALGAGLTSWWEYGKQRRSEKKDAGYLAAIVATELERFSAKCLDVLQDDLRDGQLDEDGCRAPQVTSPEFHPRQMAVEWRSLPADLMFEILDLPYRIELARIAISGAREYAAESHRIMKSTLNSGDMSSLHWELMPQVSRPDCGA